MKSTLSVPVCLAWRNKRKIPQSPQMVLYLGRAVTFVLTDSLLCVWWTCIFYSRVRIGQQKYAFPSFWMQVQLASKWIYWSRCLPHFPLLNLAGIEGKACVHKRCISQPPPLCPDIGQYLSLGCWLVFVPTWQIVTKQLTRMSSSCLDWGWW